MYILPAKTHPRYRCLHVPAHHNSFALACPTNRHKDRGIDASLGVDLCNHRSVNTVSGRHIGIRRYTHHIRVFDVRLGEASDLRFRKAGNNRNAVRTEGLEKRLSRGEPSREHHSRWVAILTVFSTKT